MIEGISDLNAFGSAASVASQSASSLGRDDFLMLLVEQMKSQDPFNPKDPSEFTAQLAQFSQLEELFKLGESLNGLTLLSASLNNTTSASFLGREILATGTSIGVRDGQASGIQYDLAADAASVEIKIFDEDGNLVHTEQMGSTAEGEADFVWDGISDNGSLVPNGTYTFTVEAKGSDGETIHVDTLIKGKVTGITYLNGITMLEMDGQLIPIANVRSVRLLDS